MPQNSKIVAYVDSLSGSARERLAAAGYIQQLPFPGPTVGDAFNTLLKANPNINALILGGQPVGPTQLALLSGLNVVARVGVGYDMIDVPSLAPRRIPLMIAGTANSASVAEEALHLMLTLAKRGVSHNRLVREGQWIASRSSHMPEDIGGKTLLVVGFGRIGTRTVKRALAMEMTVLVFDPFVSAEAILAAGAVPVAYLDDAIPVADFITLHCPRTPESIGLIDARRLAMMKPGAFLINTARGGIIDETALYAALKSRKLAGAGLDVLEKEPAAKDHPLFELENVIVAPHVAGVTREALDRMSMASVENVLSVFEGRPIRANVINPDVLG